MILALVLFTAFINIVLGIVVYNKNPRSDTHRLLTLLTVIFAAWTVSNYFSLNSANSSDTLFWIRAVMFITAPLGPVLYLFIKTYPRQKLIISPIKLNMLILLTLATQSLAFTPYIFSDVIIGTQINPTPEVGIILFALLFVGMPIIGLIELVKKYRKSFGLERLQLKYLIVGIAETFVLLIVTNFVSVVIFKFSGFVIFGPMFSLILVGFITYSIIRHRLLEIRVILARSVVYTLLIAIVATFYTFAVFIGSQVFFGRSVSVSEALIRIILALFVAFTLIPIRGFLEQATDKVFFKGKYDPNVLIFQLIKITAATINLNELMNKTLRKIISTMRISHGSFVLYKTNLKYKIFSQNFNFNDKQIKFIGSLYKLNRLSIYDEENNKKIKESMLALDCALVMPLIERGEKIGLLILGEKKSGQIYSQKSINVIELFGPVIAVAIQNARAYEEIKNFNLTLKEKVNSSIKELQLANLQLKKMGIQKDEFMAIASHELKTPLTSVNLYVQLLRNKLTQKKDKLTIDFVDKIDKQIKKLVNLINDLLDVSRIEEGKIKFNMEDFNLDILVEDIVNDMQLMIRQKIINKNKQSITVNADKDRIGQVISNFISNASKYSPKTSIIIINTKIDNSNIILSVEDSGMGLTPEEKAIVFEKFNRAGQEGPSGTPGLGLGLYISKEIIKRHGGDIWVESKKGVGSTFYFSIPINK